MDANKNASGIVLVGQEKDSWSELEALELETKNLLESIKGKPKGSSKTQKQDKSRGTKDKDSNKGKPKLKEKTSDLTAKKINQNDNYHADWASKGFSDPRSTVEILDDSSPEGTPRKPDKGREEENNKRRVKYKELMGFEEPFQSMQFGLEKARVKGKSDTFVAYIDGVSAADVEIERARLAKLEDSARRIRLVQKADAERRNKYLLKDKLAIKIQRVFRGHLGRKKFLLTKKLHSIMVSSNDREEGLSDWIQVSDPQTGDAWYFNKATNKSQWEKPEELLNPKSTTKSGKKVGFKPAKDKLPLISDKSDIGGGGAKFLRSPPVHEDKRERARQKLDRSALLSMSLPTLNNGSSSNQNTNLANTISETDARREVEDILGIHKITKPDNLIAPNGYFKPQLRVTVQDALLETRFDSVSTVLADSHWFEGDEDLFGKKQKALAAKVGVVHSNTFSDETKVDLSRTPLISTIVFNKKKPKAGKRLESTGEAAAPAASKLEINGTQDLTFKEVEHPGFENPAVNDLTPMCFGCWSAGGKRKCVIHEEGGVKMKTSQTMLLCRNWDLSVMQRRYRAEEIQELFMKREKALRFDPRRKTFTTIVELKHPVYRWVSQINDSFNERHYLFEKIKRWIRSVLHQIKAGKVKFRGKFGPEFVKRKSDEVSLVAHKRVFRFTQLQQHRLTTPPITGYSWPERQGVVQYLFKHVDKTHGEEVDLIHIYPLPVPVKLYELRVYHVSIPKSIPMPKPSYKEEVAILPTNKVIEEFHKAAWIERLCSSCVRDSISSAKAQIQAITPLTSVDIAQRTKRPSPNTISFATLGQKPALHNLALGGLATELLVYQLIVTFLPPQYGNFMTMDKAVVSPGVTPETTLSFESVPVPPVLQQYVHRPLEHPLNYRRAPTITANSSVMPENRHYYGKNRPEQTGEQESHGFRTTAWAPCLLSYSETDPQAFVPGAGIVTLNTTKANLSVTTHADQTYPFCEPSSRDNSTLDFYHLLLQGCCSMSKAQIFTVLTVQEPGKFLKDYRADLPFGHVLVTVYRSWGFTQKETIQEFKTDDGISYWYHRKTGQTFWERPLLEPEEASPLLGGTVLDMEHAEEPTVVTKGTEGSKRRYLQGEFRKQMMFGIEKKAEALSRRMAAAATVQAARDRGAIPAPSEMERIGTATATATASSLRSVSTANSTAEEHTAKSASISRNGGDRPKDPPLNEWQMKMINQNDEMRNNPALLTAGTQQGFGAASVFSHSSTVSASANTHGSGYHLPSGGMGIDQNMMMALSQSLTQMLGTMMNMDQTNPQDMIQLGLGMGMALLGTGAVQGVVEKSNDFPRTGGDSAVFDRSGAFEHGVEGSSIQEQLLESEGAGFFPSVDPSMTASPATAPVVDPFDLTPPAQQPIGLARPNLITSADKPVDHREADRQKSDILDRTQQPLNSLERARNLKIDSVLPTDTPDAIPQKVLTHTLPANAEEMVKSIVPIVAYPELSTHANQGQGAPATYQRHGPAGLGTSFVTKDEATKQLMVKETELKLRRTVMPLPVGFFDSVVAKHVAQQAADYLPQVLNMPQSRTIGRVRPRSAAADWLMISFDPWSAGKNPLGTEFVPSLLDKADKILKGQAKAVDSMEMLRQKALGDSMVELKDTAGLAAQRNEVSKAEILARDYKKLCSLCRHGKFADAEQLINQPDWNVPIDYQDEQGNALLHIVAQNGNKRMMKLCLRRGAALNIQNLAGQTPLHFAFGFGYNDAGNYLLSKGADDTIRNADGLTCYEGLLGRELALL